ncbi:MAG: hypothetical protein K2W95_31505 [Candidatus Obscuribacterales bacterium]|nr:hypothetical protein [Candidatus Obscuribacterales bacterium]
MFFQLQELRAYSGEAVLPYTLVVVDCQPGFAAAREEWLRLAVAERVRQAVRACAPVVLLEMSPGMNQPTYDAISRLIPSQTPFCRLSKYQADGSVAVQSVCAAGKFPSARFEVCGVNTDLCVFSTTCGLLRRNPEVTVTIPTAACNCEHDANPWESLAGCMRNQGLLLRCSFQRGFSPKNKGAWSVD